MFLFMRIRPKSRTVSVDLKVLSSNTMALIIVALIAIPLFHQTVEVFKGVREQTQAVIAVRDWINNDAMSMRGLQVRGDQVTVDLLVSIPLGQFGPEEALMPRQWIPPRDAQGEAQRMTVPQAISEILTRLSNQNSQVMGKKVNRTPML